MIGNVVCNVILPKLLGTTLTVHFGGIDQCDPHIECGTNNLYLVLGLVWMLTNMPGAEPEYRFSFPEGSFTFRIYFYINHSSLRKWCRREYF